MPRIPLVSRDLLPWRHRCDDHPGRPDLRHPTRMAHCSSDQLGTVRAYFPVGADPQRNGPKLSKNKEGGEGFPTKEHRTNFPCHTAIFPSLHGNGNNSLRPVGQLGSAPIPLSPRTGGLLHTRGTRRSQRPETLQEHSRHPIAANRRQ